MGEKRVYKKVRPVCQCCHKPIGRDERVAVINYVDLGRVYVHAERCRTEFANKRFEARKKIKSGAA